VIQNTVCCGVIVTTALPRQIDTSDN